MYSLQRINQFEKLVVQKASLPTASAENVGRIYQYTWETTVSSPIYINWHFYKSVSDWQNPATYSREEVILGWWGSSELTANLTSNVEVGWVPANTTFVAWTPLETIIRQMLIKYISPVVSLSISPSTSPVISGDVSINSITLTAVATKRSEDITSIKMYANNVLINEETVGVESGGTFTYTYTPANPITDDITLKVEASDSQSTVSDTKSINFVDGSYFGDVADSVTNPTAADITALTKVALANKNYTASGINVTYGKLLYAYPASYGDLTSIKDWNNFEYINSYTKSVVTIDGISYNCYLMTDAAGLTDFKQIYS